MQDELFSEKGSVVDWLRSHKLESALLAVALLLPFYRLGIGEIQSWDEALYAIRANACLMFGAWFDQTGYAVGHLYSGTHPPLGVWMIALSKTLFGGGTFAIRFPSALSAALAVWFFFLVARMVCSERAAWFASISFATADLFLLYSHRAQMESFLLLFSCLTLFAYCKGMRSKSLTWFVLTGLFLGCALLSKFGEGLYMLPGLAVISWRAKKGDSLRAISIVTVVALIVVMPWFIAMAIWHRDYWAHVSESLGVISGGTYSISHLSWYYYLNRLLIALPLLPVVFLGGGRRKKIWVWLVLVFLALQSVGTKMPHFAVLLLLPGSLIVGLSLDSFGESNGPWKWTVASVVALLLVWSRSEQLRLWVTHRLPGSALLFPSVVLVLICIALFGLILAIGKRDRVNIGVAGFLLVTAVLHLSDEQAAVFQSGAPIIAAKLDSISQDTLLILHDNFPNEQYSPQLGYYTSGTTLGWKASVIPAEVTWSNGLLEPIDTMGKVVIVERFRDRFNVAPVAEKDLLDSLDRKLEGAYRQHIFTRAYHLFY